MTLILIVILILMAMAAPPFFKNPPQSLKRLGHCVLVSFFGVLLPLFIFFFSAFLIPEWKGVATHGWLDCFHKGKLLLFPIVLFATGSLYAVELFPPNRLREKGAALGLFLGCITATVCFVFGLSCLPALQGLGLFLVVPLYTAVWQGIRVWKLRGVFGSDPLPWMLALIGSVPLWVWSVMWSKKLYANLPATAPDCFVVTAASRGHASFVGPFIEIPHKEQQRSANLQLATLWQFESLWRNRSPRSHASFRRVYNRVGPVMAKRIQHPLLADFAFILIKPIELTARLIIYSNRNNV